MTILEDKKLLLISILGISITIYFLYPSDNKELTTISNPKRKNNKKFIIRDWAGNILFNEKEFDSFDDAWEYIYEKIDDDEAYDDYYVEEKSNKKSNPFGLPSQYVVKDLSGKILFDKKRFKSIYHAWDYIHKHHPNEDENNYRVTMKGIK